MCAVGSRSKPDFILPSFVCPLYCLEESLSSTVFSVVVRVEISKKSFRFSPWSRGERRKDFLYALPNQILVSAEPFFSSGCVFCPANRRDGLAFLCGNKLVLREETACFAEHVVVTGNCTFYTSIIFLSLPESRKRITAAAPLMKTKSMKKSNRFSMG